MLTPPPALEFRLAHSLSRELAAPHYGYQPRFVAPLCLFWAHTQKEEIKIPLFILDLIIIISKTRGWVGFSSQAGRWWVSGWLDKGLVVLVWKLKMNG